MQIDPVPSQGELLRRTMRRWATGVTIVTSRFGEMEHGMTVSSFVSVSIDPALVTISLNHDSRTCALVQQSGIFGVTILSKDQQTLAEVFAGRGDPAVDRMKGLDTFYLLTGAPLIRGGVGYVDCRVVDQYPMLSSTLFIAEVAAAQPGAENIIPLVYYNRSFGRLDG